MKRRPWTEAELRTLRLTYADVSTAILAAQLGRTLSMVYGAANKMGIRKSAEYLASPEAFRWRREQTSAQIAKQFKPGHTPQNKGLRRPGWSPGRMASTQFKPGTRHGNAAKLWCAVGTIRPDSEGFLRIKVREWEPGEAHGFGNTKIWPLLNRHVWEQHKGPIPVGHAVVFKDGDRSNVTIENLELISRRDLMLRNSSQRWGKEIFQLIQLRGAINRQLRSRSEEQNKRSA